MILPMTSPFNIADDARCQSGGGHRRQETNEDWRNGRPVQVLKCSQCGNESVGYLETRLGWPAPKGVDDGR
jgi:hypothetical protein